MIGTTNYREADPTSEVELTLVRVKLEDSPKSFNRESATGDRPDHPRGQVLGD